MVGLKVGLAMDILVVVDGVEPDSNAKNPCELQVFTSQDAMIKKRCGTSKI